MWLEVLDLNANAARLYERLGFTREGVMRAAYTLDGARRDLAIYGLLAEEWAVTLPPQAPRLAHTA